MTTSTHSLESLAKFIDFAKRRYEDNHQASQSRTASAPSADVGDAPVERGSRGAPLLATESHEIDAAWERAARIYQEGTIVSGIVTGWNRGGLLVRWDALQGFVPASQLKEVPVFESAESRDEKLARWVGEELDLKVIELDRGRNRLVFSERATVWGPKDGERLLQEITPGETRRGHVSNLVDFGAFVDLGGVDGLIHLSELSWSRISHPREIVKIGDPVDVYVISVDREHHRIALSLKRTQPDPWTMVDSRYAVGQVLTATITNVVDFGAFAELEEGLEGLIHISEIADARVAHPSEVVSPGDTVQVRILRLDSAAHRIALSMRIAEPEAAEEPATPPSSDEAEWDANASYLY
ncbi:MAG TPA: S1 RNA-binding domain-containing protein [Chloroflexi bacterium]|jgi:small subunit ribosomal protein S1|nr:S1 RNA-binding domain-containing protein [Chloroflexota bacterium]